MNIAIPQIGHFIAIFDGLAGHLGGATSIVFVWPLRMNTRQNGLNILLNDNI